MFSVESVIENSVLPIYLLYSEVRMISDYLSDVYTVFVGIYFVFNTYLSLFDI